MSQDDYVYIAVKPCGCVDAIAIDVPEYKDHTAEFVAKQIKDGYAVERLPREDGVDRMTQECEHGTLGDQLTKEGAESGGD